MTPRTGRATLLGAVGTVLMGAVTWWLLATAASTWPGPGRVGMDAGLAFLVLAAAGLLAGWAAVLMAAATTALAVESSHRHDPRGGGSARHPRAATAGLTGRIAAGLLVAASVGIAPANAVQTPGSAVVAVHAGGPAKEVAGAHDKDDPATRQHIPVPGWTPTLSGAEQHVRPVPGEVILVSTSAVTDAEGEVVVHRGDTLWDIAARHLGEAATDEDVAEAWPRWYEANKEIIGTDPDLIHPGQRLVVPTPGGAR